MISETALKNIIIDFFKLDAEPEVISMENIDAWDSVEHLNLILTIESTTGYRFDMSAIPNMTSLLAIHKEMNGCNNSYS